MDRLDAMRLFVRLVETGSFTAVARAEGMGQPAVSKQIGALERYLGAQLLARTSRQVSVTEAGQTFYASAKALLDDFDVAESSVGERQQSPRGLIRLSTSPAHGRLCITPLLPEFFRRYPKVEIQMGVSERHVDMIGDGIDLAVRHGRMQDSSMIARKLCDSPFVLVASRGYLAAHAAPERFDDLDSHDCVVFAHGRERRPWLFGSGNDAVAYLPRGPFMTGDAEQIRAAILSGLGVAQVPAWVVAPEIATGEVQVLLPQIPCESIPTFLVHPAGRRVPMRVKLLMDYLHAAFAPTA
ncbi:LysR family transcriptional regulator [Paraburkholderia sp. DHOC27]|uniref:LysR family transcriptional regulator n=1 Tax=Paraburkholderia sp. DHOC27 TaxID=2303330 RepID=UPI000E3E1075|nr:LysR family transcriptional regulator [Paraburkholderia sp. DHOC27]RFU49718.1 LysR family transcriptional regulator [Paraburkholderia sp. DHOC27]